MGRAGGQQRCGAGCDNHIRMQARTNASEANHDAARDTPAASCTRRRGGQLPSGSTHLELRHHHHPALHLFELLQVCGADAHLQQQRRQQGRQEAGRVVGGPDGARGGARGAVAVIAVGARPARAGPPAGKPKGGQWGAQCASRSARGSAEAKVAGAWGLGGPLPASPGAPPAPACRRPRKGLWRALPTTSNGRALLARVGSKRAARRLRDRSSLPRRSTEPRSGGDPPQTDHRGQGRGVGILHPVCRLPSHPFTSVMLLRAQGSSGRPRDSSPEPGEEGTAMGLLLLAFGWKVGAAGLRGAMVAFVRQAVAGEQEKLAGMRTSQGWDVDNAAWSAVLNAAACRHLARSPSSLPLAWAKA